MHRILFDNWSNRKMGKKLFKILSRSSHLDNILLLFCPQHPGLDSLTTNKNRKWCVAGTFAVIGADGDDQLQSSHTSSWRSTVLCGPESCYCITQEVSNSIQANPNKPQQGGKRSRAQLNQTNQTKLVWVLPKTRVCSNWWEFRLIRIKFYGINWVS